MKALSLLFAAAGAMWLSGGVLHLIADCLVGIVWMGGGLALLGAAAFCWRESHD